MDVKCRVKQYCSKLLVLWLTDQHYTQETAWTWGQLEIFVQIVFIFNNSCMSFKSLVPTMQGAGRVHSASSLVLPTGTLLLLSLFPAIVLELPTGAGSSQHLGKGGKWEQPFSHLPRPQLPVRVIQRQCSREFCCERISEFMFTD